MSDNMINGIGSWEEGYKQLAAQNEELRTKLAAALNAESNAMDRVIALQDVLVEFMDVNRAGDEVIVGGGLWDRGIQQLAGYGDLPWGGKA